MAAVLDPVIPDGPPVVDALVDEPVCVLQGLFAGEPLALRVEVFLHDSHGFFTLSEARQVLLAHDHHFNQHDDLVGVLLQRHEALVEQLPEFGEFLGVQAAEDVDELLRELEGRLFELQATAREAGEEEAKVDVHDVAVGVDEDVLVVSVLDLQDVAHEGVAGKTRTEGVLRLLVCF